MAHATIAMLCPALAEYWLMMMAMKLRNKYCKQQPAIECVIQLSQYCQSASIPEAADRLKDRSESEERGTARVQDENLENNRYV